MKLFAITQFSEKYNRPLYFNLQFQSIWQNDLTNDSVFEEDLLPDWKAYIEEKKFGKIVEVIEVDGKLQPKYPITTAEEYAVAANQSHQ